MRPDASHALPNLDFWEALFINYAYPVSAGITY